MFALALDRQASALREALGWNGISRSRNLYLLGLTGLSTNVKLREANLEVKQLLDTSHDGLERWRPVARSNFPIDPDALPWTDGSRHPGPVTLPQLLERCCRPQGRGVVMHVVKVRQHFCGDGLLGEVCRLVVNGARIDTLAVEGTDPHAVAGLRRHLDLQGVPNTSYPRALSQIAGLEPLTDRSPWHAFAAVPE